MDTITALLIDWGYWGMLIAAFVAGSFLPFSSEVVILGLHAAGLDTWTLIVYATIGNVLGGLFNYSIGRQGRLDWIEKYLHVKQKDLDRAQRFMGGRGALMGFFAFLPIIGSAITIVLGLMRANLVLSTTSITVGKFLRYVVLMASAGALVGCSSATTATQPRITVTIEPLRYFAEAIVDHRFEVTTMVPQNSNPETYEPTARQMMTLHESELYIKVGEIGFERTWSHKLEENAPQTRFIDSSQGMALMGSVGSHSHTHDPHTWMSCANARIIARNIYEAVAKLMPKDSATFRANYERLCTRIDSVDRVVRATLPAERPLAFLIYHPTLTYFARDYHLAQIAIEEEGHEPSAAQLQQLIISARQQKPRVLFVQKEFANRNLRILEESTHTHAALINPLAYDWANEMISIATKLQ